MAGKRVLSGVQPSVDASSWQHFGMIVRLCRCSRRNKPYFIANYHATQLPDPALLRQRTFDVALDFLACG